MVGPLLVRQEPRPLQPSLQRIVDQAGERGIVLARCVLGWHPQAAGSVQPAQGSCVHACATPSCLPLGCSFGSIFRPGSCAVARGLAAALARTNRTVVWAVNATHLPGAPWLPAWWLSALWRVLGSGAVMLRRDPEGPPCCASALPCMQLRARWPPWAFPLTCTPWPGRRKATCSASPG